MKSRQLGDIAITRILEREAPLTRPLDRFDKALPEAVELHRHWLEPKALDPETGMMILPVQSYLLRTRHHSILIDTCIGCRKTYDGMPEWKDLRDETWLDRHAAAGRRLSPTPNTSWRRRNTRPARRPAPKYFSKACCPSWKPGKRFRSIWTTPSTTRSG